MSASLLTIGELILFLAIWIAICDIRNEFMLVLLAVGLAFLGIGLVLE